MDKILITCHGYTGYPSEMEPFGTYFEGRGWDWINLHLPGHGTTAEDLKDVTWRTWTDYVDQQVEKYLQRSDTVVFAGLSLGGVMKNILPIRGITPAVSDNWISLSRLCDHVLIKLLNR